ncbi:MAG: hypothetical protein LE178_04200 [Endomicrobium sp.]|nr:hypothetical protein [Endomicrobium sp.]
MTALRLRRCVSLFVCLSLLLSACSPDKSSKASGFTRNTEVGEDSVEEIVDYVPSAGNNNDVHPVSFWNREIGKVGELSITPKRITYTVAVIGGIFLIYGSYKWDRLKEKEEKLIKEINKLKEQSKTKEKETLETMKAIAENQEETTHEKENSRSKE